VSRSEIVSAYFKGNLVAVRRDFNSDVGNLRGALTLKSLEGRSTRRWGERALREKKYERSHCHYECLPSSIKKTKNNPPPAKGSTHSSPLCALAVSRDVTCEDSHQAEEI